MKKETYHYFEVLLFADNLEESCRISMFHANALDISFIVETNLVMMTEAYICIFRTSSSSLMTKSEFVNYPICTIR